MPIREYVCKKCKKVLEVIESINDEPQKDKKCECGSVLVFVEFSTTNFQLKGRGWHKTDYAK